MAGGDKPLDTRSQNTNMFRPVAVKSERAGTSDKQRCVRPQQVARLKSGDPRHKVRRCHATPTHCHVTLYVC
ncbi:hypothetical protein J6590_031995 [Homalodisca vitripennis]|nr:hypothetical protein J6590_031995 [Homalodisca vitripennis]